MLTNLERSASAELAPPTSECLCPCCGTPAQLTQTLPKNSILDNLERLMCDSGIRLCEIADYRIMSCPNCFLEFADPMLEGSGDFYEWVTRSAKTYPTTRWEWFECHRVLLELSERAAGRSFHLLDVGCGSGHFLHSLKLQPRWQGIGLDFNAAAIDLCHSKGLHAIQGDIGNVRSLVTTQFDAITLWHVVEHVSNPVRLISEAKMLLNSEGMIFFSVPISPLSYEASWTDPLNSPPHHLTRWCISAIEALAKSVEMSVDIFLPEADGIIKRVARTLFLQSASPYSGLSKPRKLAKLASFIIRRPWQPFVDTYLQTRRTRHKGKILPDVVMVCLSLPTPKANR